MDSDEGEGFG
jgi:hypothetical protein